MIDRGEGVVLSGAAPGNARLWVSRSLLWLVAPAELTLPDDLSFVVVFPEQADRWIAYRLATAEWLTWLRDNYLRGKDPTSTVLLQARQRRLKAVMQKYVPDLVGAAAVLPAGYEPPPMDGVENARL